MLKVNGVTNLRPLNLPRNIKKALLLVLLLLPQKFLLLKALVMSSLRMSRQTLSLALLLLCKLEEKKSKIICLIFINCIFKESFIPCKSKEVRIITCARGGLGDGEAGGLP